jgi:hypothetical protein
MKESLETKKQACHPRAARLLASLMQRFDYGAMLNKKISEFPFEA